MASIPSATTPIVRNGYDTHLDVAPIDTDASVRSEWLTVGHERAATTVIQPVGRTYDLSVSFVAPRTTSWLDNAATGGVPDGWGAGVPNRSGVGTRWTDPSNLGNGIRLDQGNPAVSLTTQQVDQVVVRHNGVVIGRDGSPIPGTIREYPELAHIPRDEWLTRSEWFKP